MSQSQPPSKPTLDRAPTPADPAAADPAPMDPTRVEPAGSPQAPESSTHAGRVAPVGSAEFWKKRIARALLVGAFALLATQILPELPTDQNVEIQAPNGYSLDSVSLTYFEPGQQDALIGTQISFSQPAPRAYHTPRLRNGDYEIHVRAHLKPRAGGENDTSNPVSETQTLTLTGERVRIFLDAEGE